MGRPDAAMVEGALADALLPAIAKSFRTSSLSILIFSSLLIWQSTSGLSVWLVLRLAVSLGCVLALRRLASGELDAERSVRSIAVLMGVSGTVWGLLGLLVQPDSPEWRAVVVLWIFGNQSVITAVCAPAKAVFWSAIGTVTMVGAVSVLAYGDRFSAVLAGLIVLGGVYSVSIFSATHRTTVAAIEGRLFAAALASSLEAGRRELKEANDSLRELADHDSLTGLLNRRAFRSTVGEHEASDQCWIGIIDVDDFKIINDSFGHAAGDAVLVELSTRWRAVLPHDAIIARLGGDEFALAFHRESERAANEVAELVSAAVDAPIGIGVGGSVQLTCSMGVVSMIADETVSSCMARADTALYEMKRAGRGGVLVRATEASAR